MKQRVAIVGAGISGLTCAVLFAENGFETSILAEEVGDETNSAAAAAIWYPYDVGSGAEIVPWALVSYRRFLELARQTETGVSLTELRVFSRLGPIAPPDWAQSFATRTLSKPEIPPAFVSGFSIRVPLIETGKYLEYLSARLTSAGGSISGGTRLRELEEIDPGFDLIINCAGIGARQLVPDRDMEPHRGQVAIVQKFDLPYAVVCDDPPLMYAIPRSNDCVFGGTNDISDDRVADPQATAQIISQCERVLNRPAPPLIRERVGLRPGRSRGVRVAAEKLGDGRTVIHNYGHGGSGFTLSWGCAETVLALAGAAMSV
ncbi:MAG TPA: FAD-dependent oxidoreductase [Chthoniobacterales bacterium]|jgi:D-amino-acid oxidase|nr:FAD-dependent oxidoreductase [Chthoniobacterales bacterium]